MTDCLAAVTAPKLWPTRFTWARPRGRTRRARSSWSPARRRKVELPDGALDGEGLTLGTYLHGLFHNRDVRLSILACAGARRGLSVEATRDEIDPSAEYDKLASLVRHHLDMGLVYRAMGLTR